MTQRTHTSMHEAHVVVENAAACGRKGSAPLQSDWPPPEFDDRPVFVTRVPDPLIQLRNRRSKQRGKAAERAWAALVQRYGGGHPEVRGGLGGADVVWDINGKGYAFELKQSRGDWPKSTVIKNAWPQAQKNAGWRTPVVVACRTLPGLPREFRVYTDCVTEGKEWIQAVTQNTEGVRE